MTDLMIAGLSSGLVLAAMAAMAVLDARRAVVDPRLVLALLAAAAVWRYLSPDGNSPWTPWTGMALGIAAVALPIAIAQWRGRRWPLYPGDAMMLGGFGFLLGPVGLAWTMLLGSAFSLAYRVWVQRRRGRCIHKGLVPLGPGMTAGAAVVFLCVNFGVAFAAGEPPPHGVPARPVSVAPLPGLTPDNALLPATELAPASTALPEAIATRDVVFEQNDAVSFPVAVRRLSSLSGISITIEERPARIAGGMAILSDAPPIRLVWRGALAGLLDRSRRRAATTGAGVKERSSSTAIGISNNALRLLACRLPPARPAGTASPMKRRRALNGWSRRVRTRPCAACSRAGRARRVGLWSGTPVAITPWDRVRSRPATLYFAVGFWRRSISCWPAIRPAALCRRSPIRRTAIW